MASIIFPDAEKIFVAALKDLMVRAGYNSDYFRVATQKSDAPAAPPVQVILRGDGGLIFDRALKEENLTLRLWVKSDSKNTAYGVANEMTLKLEAILPLVASVSGSVNDVSAIDTTPLTEDGEEELREITFTAILKGQNYTLPTT